VKPRGYVVFVYRLDMAHPEDPASDALQITEVNKA
jgi:hypothetical protein